MPLRNHRSTAPTPTSQIAMPTVLVVTLTFCRGVVAVTGAAVEQASSRGPAVPGSWVQQREKRDGPEHHLTLLSKVDLQQLSQRIAEGASSWCQEVPTPDANDMPGIAKAAAALLGKMSCTWDWVDVGTGSCKDATGEASFRVVLWPAAAAWRERLELPPKDFHITLGFQDADVHSKSKGVASLRSPEAASIPRLLQLAQRLIPGDLEDFGPCIEQMLETVQQGEMDVEMQVQALRLWCTYHGRQKQPQQVLLHADQLLELSGNDAVAVRSRGLALVMLQRYQEAWDDPGITSGPGQEALDALQRADDLQPAEGPEAQRVAQAVAICRKKLGGKADGNGYALAANVAADDPKSPAKGNYPKTPHLPFSPGVNPDDTRISDCKHLLEAEVVVTEKLDGGNCCLKDGQVFGRTHAQPASHESFSAVKELAANLGPQLEGVQLFGENMQAVHSIEYGNLQRFFYVFAARRGSSWLSWDETTQLAEDLGLPMVPLVFRGKFDSPERLQKCLEMWKAEKSAVGADVEAEGFVVRRSAAIHEKSFQDEVAKFVRANHIQTDEAWKRKWKKASIGPELEPVQEDGDIFLHTVSGDRVHVFASGHKQAISQLALSPMQDEYVVATADVAGVIRVHRLLVRPRRNPQEQRRRVTNPEEEKFDMICSVEALRLGTPQSSRAQVKLPNSVQSPKSSTKPEPVTPKQRKQAAYASSMSFDSGSLTADHKNPQDPSRQLQVSTDTEKARGPPLKVRVSIPSPRDCKATMLQGSGVVQVTDGSPILGFASGVSFFFRPGWKKGESRSPKKKASVQFFVEDEPAEVMANRRLMARRYGEARDSWTQLSSGARKQRDLVSQVLGGTPKAAAPQSSPAPLSPRNLSPRNYAVHETRLPLSAREQKANEMTTSESQLNGFASPTSKSLSPRNAAMKSFRDGGNDGLRRSNCQFTDLTGRVETSPRTPRRSELQDTAGVYWMNPSTEKSRKIAERQGRTNVETTGSLIHHQGAEVDVENLSPRSVPESPQQRKVRQEERACYDAASWKQASSEVARRRRELRTSKSMGALPDSDGALSPSDRKRAHLASGQMREGIGDMRQKQEDTAAAPGWVSPRAMRSTVIQAPMASNRALMNQPNMYQYRNLPANSPRARKAWQTASAALVRDFGQFTAGEFGSLWRVSTHLGSPANITAQFHLATRIPLGNSSDGRRAQPTAFVMTATQGVKYFLVGDSVGWISVFTRNGTLHERKAYRELALLHHPDKGGSDGDFKLLRRAYEDGLIAVKRAEEVAYKPKPGAQLVEVEERQWPLHPAAAKVRVRGAVDQWEHDYDLGQVSSVPDDIPEISSEELAQWLLKGAAVALDCRELIEAKYERRTPVVPGIAMSFGDLRSAPDLLSRHLVRLVDSDCQVVTFSTRGGTSGNCGMCAALLIDVFGMKASRFWRLEGGLDDWFAWAAQNPDIIRALPERSAIELLRVSNGAVTRINAHLGNVVYVAGNQWGMLDLEKGTARAFNCYKYPGTGVLDAVTDTALQTRIVAADLDGTIWVFSMRDKRDCKVEHRFPSSATRAPLSLASVRGFILVMERARSFTGKAEVTVLNMTHVGKSWDDPARDTSPVSWKRSSRPLRDWDASAVGKTCQEAKVEKLAAEARKADVIHRDPDELAPRRKVLPPLADSKLRILMKEFRKLDKDGSGEVSKDELAVALRDVFPGVNIDELMMVFDTDSNGKVGYSEFAPLSKVISTFEQFDTDSNGLISREELKAVLQRLDPNFNDQQLDELMTSIDFDISGSLNIVEFVMYVADYSDELGIKLEQTAAILAGDTRKTKAEVIELS
eukprot:s2351_g6.t1